MFRYLLVCCYFANTKIGESFRNSQFLAHFFGNIFARKRAAAPRRAEFARHAAENEKSARRRPPEKGLREGPAAEKERRVWQIRKIFVSSSADTIVP